MKPNSSELRALGAAPDMTHPPTAPWLRWLANYGLSLSAADCVLESAQERGSSCPFAQLLEQRPRRR